MKKLLFIPIILIVLLIIIFVAAGTPLVLGILQQKIEQTMEDALGMPMTIGSMSGNLFFALRAGDIEVKDLGRVDQIKITYNPFGLLYRRVDVRSVQINGLELDLDRLLDILGNLPKKVDSLPSKSSPLKIQIERFSIAECGVGLKIGKTPLSMVFSSRGTLFRDRLVLDILHIETKRSVAVLKGVVPLVKAGEFDLAFDIDLAAEDLGVPELGGVMSSTGTLKGDLSSPVMTAQTQLAARILESDVTGVIDMAWQIPRFDSLKVKADLRLTTAGLQKGMSRYDTWVAEVLLERTQFSAEVMSRYGEVRAHGVLKGKLSQPQFEGAVSGHLDYQGFKPSFEGRLCYGDDVLEFTHFELASKRVTMAFGACYDNRTKRITDAELSMYCNDLGVARSIIDAPEDISGELWLDVDVSGAVENPDAVARLRLSDLVSYGEVLPTALLQVSMRNNVARLDSGTIQSVRGLIDVQGHYDLKKEDFALAINSESLAIDAPTVHGVDTLMIGGKIALHIVGSGDIRNPRGQGEITFDDVTYDTLQLGDYLVEFLFADTTLQLSLADEHSSIMLAVEVLLQGDLPFNATAEIRHFALDRYASPASGYVTADLTAGGCFSDLSQTTAALQIDTIELEFEKHKLHSSGPIAMELEDGIIRLHQFTLALAGQTIQLQGIVPVDFKTAAMDVSGKSSNMQLSEIAYFLPGTPTIAGSMTFDIRVQGKLQQLDIDGRLELDGANYAVKDVVLDSVSARFLFKNGLVTCETLSGKINAGRFEVNGFVDLSHGRIDTLRITMDLKRIDYANKDFGHLLVDAGFRAEGRRDSVRIKGEIVVLEGVYDAPVKLQKIVGLLTTANRPVPERSDVLKRIYCDIGVSVPDSFRIRNNVAELAAKADLEVKGYLARPNAYGTITAVGGGSVQYLGRKFTIVNAVIQFDDPYKIDPIIDLAAMASVSAADGEYDIYLFLNGTVTTWQLRLSSNPPVPEQDIISLLLIGQRRPGEVTGLAGDVDLKGKARDYALDAVRQGLQKTTQDLLHLDKFTISGDLSDPSTVRVGIEKNVARGFRLIYTTGVESWELHQIGAVYDLTDHISVFTLHDQENLNTSADLDFHLELK